MHFEQLSPLRLASAYSPRSSRNHHRLAHRFVPPSFLWTTRYRPASHGGSTSRFGCLRATDGTAIAKAIDYSLGRWQALVRFLDDGSLPIDNNWLENRIRPIALGRTNWLFAGSLRAGKRAATVMSLVQSAKLNGHDPYRYLKDVLQRLPSQPHSRIEELLPHRWVPTG